MAERPVSLSDLKIDSSARAEPGGHRGRNLVLAVIALAVAGGLGFFLWRGAAVHQVRAADVQVVTSGGANDSVLDGSGYVTARRQATVSSKVTGKVIEILVEEGMRVTEGQVLARLDDSLLRRQIDLDNARLTAARSSLNELEVRLAEAALNLKRSGQLAASGVAAQAQLDADQATVDSFKAQIARTRDDATVADRTLAMSRELLTDATIRAPFSGVAISKDAQPGEMISPVSAGGGFTRTGICTLVDMSSLEIEVDVREAYINRVANGQRVEAVLDSYPDWQIPAHVITIIPTASRDKATVKVRIAFDQLDPRILPDMGVKVRFFAEERAAAAQPARRVRVPQAAVREDGGSKVVFVIAGGRVERRAVTVGAADGDQIEVTAGLTGGERVVVLPPPGLVDGARVKTIE